MLKKNKINKFSKLANIITNKKACTIFLDDLISLYITRCSVDLLKPDGTPETNKAPEGKCPILCIPDC